MTKKFILSLPAILLATQVLCQDIESTSKRANHYLGVQANQLIKQLFNFGGSTSSINNPYLLTYSVNSVNTGWGFNSGMGYEHSEVVEQDPFNPLTTTINDFFIRLGVERKRSIGKKWMGGYGLDILRDSKKNVTESNSQFGNFKTETRDKATGIGLRLTLNYSISEKILLGTEATYYYKSIKHSQKTTNQPEVDEKLKEFIFTVPVALFLIIKF